MSSEPKPKLMVSLRLKPTRTSLPDVLADFGLAASEVDADFGVVCIDPRAHLYTILVEAQSAARLQGVEGVRGAHSNPRIEPFGPPT